MYSDNPVPKPDTPISAENQPVSERTIDLYELLLHIGGKIRFVILATLLGGLLAGFYSFYVADPVYSSTSKLYVLSSSDSALNLSDLQIGTYLTSDYIEVFRTWEVHEQVIQNLDLPYTYTQLSNMLTINNPSNTRILSISILSNFSAEAAMIANEYAQVASDYIAEKMSTDRPNLLSVALPSTMPVSPNKPRNIVLGALLGFLLSIAILTIQFITDDRIKSADDIIKTIGIPVLAAVPLLNDKTLIRMQKANAASTRKKEGMRK